MKVNKCSLELYRQMHKFDCSGDAYPIGECDNASRVIKYVMLLGYRYSHYNLVDMRIHDINVEADLNQHNPNAPSPDDPVDFDGTSTGSSYTPSSYMTADNLFNDATSYYRMGWLQEWWPTLFLKVLSVDAEVLLYITVDLLGSFSLISCAILNYYLEMAGITEGISWFEAWITAGIFPEVMSFYSITLGAWMAADGLKLVLGAPWMIAAGAALGLWVVFLGINIGYVWTGLQAGFNDEWARNIYIGTILAILYLTLGLATIEEKLTTIGSNLIIKLLAEINKLPIDNWSPVTSTMTNIFRIVTLGIFSVAIIFHQGRIMGWW